MSNRIDSLTYSRDEFLKIITNIPYMKELFFVLFGTKSHRPVEEKYLSLKYKINLKKIIESNRIRLKFGKTGNSRHHKSPHGTWKCRYCGVIFESKHKLYDHYHKCHKEKMELHVSWNKGLTSETSLKVKNAAEKIKRKYETGELIPPRLGKHLSKEAKEKLSEFQRNLIYNRVCKKTQPYQKKDGSVVNLDSSYEIKIAKILDDHDIRWERPKPLVWIDHEGKTHHYFPDFFLNDHNIYLDPKNDYCFKVQKEKIDYVLKNYKNVFFLTKNDLMWEFILDIISKTKFL